MYYFELEFFLLPRLLSADALALLLTWSQMRVQPLAGSLPWRAFLNIFFVFYGKKNTGW